jgi:hypothetical protein
MYTAMMIFCCMIEPSHIFVFSLGCCIIMAAACSPKEISLQNYPPDNESTSAIPIHIQQLLLLLVG